MTEDLKVLLQYRGLLTVLFIIMSTSFLVFPFGDIGLLLFKIAIGCMLVVVPIFIFVDIQGLLDRSNEAK